MLNYLFGSKNESKYKSEDIACIIKAQSFIRKALAVVKKKGIVKNKFTDLEDQIKLKKSNIFEFYSKKEWRLRSSNDIENKIIFDDNTFLFNKHYAFIIKDMNHKFMTRFILPLKLLDINKSLKFSCAYSSENNKEFDISDFEENVSYCYNGQVSLNSELFGFGSLLLPNNTVVYGLFNNGLLLSPSRIYYKNGDFYEGKLNIYNR